MQQLPWGKTASYKFFIESTRLKKWKRSGIIWWNILDGWPQFSDAVVDYYFGKKLAYHYIRRVQEPFCIMMDEPNNWHVSVMAGNDSNMDADGCYTIRDADTGKTVSEGRFHVKANENKILTKIRLSLSQHTMYLIEWTLGNKTYANHYLSGFPSFDLEIYKCWLKQIAAMPGGFDERTVGQ